MEPIEVFQSKLSDYKKALKGLKDSLEIDLDDFDEIVSDSIRNGQIQKFEYCTELTWKIIKRFLYLFAGVDTSTPKETIKGYFNAKYIDIKGYERLMEMIDDRNRLSHIYRHDFFEEIYVKLKNYCQLMEKVSKRVQAETCRDK